MLTGRLLVVVLALWALAACAPPPETAATASGDGETEVLPAPDRAGGVRDTATAGNDHPVAVTYRRLASGGRGATCPVCSQVQPEGSEACAGCDLALTSWPIEWVCTLCSGDGGCRRCGDDRSCLECGGDGRCTTCSGTGTGTGTGPGTGTGQADGAVCLVCGGSQGCRDCGGDGWRESVHGDFGPDETPLPGLCTTCLDGTGACPDCGGLGTAEHGGSCATCAGSTDCPECDGTGACPADRGAGFCVVCSGAGREVRNAPRPPPATRRWNLRLADGRTLTSDVVTRPKPDVVVRRMERGQLKEIAFVPQKLHPVTHYQAVRDHTDPDDVEEVLDLVAVARLRNLPPLALRDLRRARTLDPRRGAAIEVQIREVRGTQIEGWLAAAAEARAAGDRRGARVLIGLAARTAVGTPRADDAAVALAALEASATDEAAALGEAARERAAAERRLRVARVVSAAEAHVARARELAGQAGREEPASVVVERLRVRADHLALSAQRRVERGALADLRDRLLLDGASRRDPAAREGPPRGDCRRARAAGGERRTLRCGGVPGPPRPIARSGEPGRRAGAGRRERGTAATGSRARRTAARGGAMTMRVRTVLSLAATLAAVAACGATTSDRRARPAPGSVPEPAVSSRDVGAARIDPYAGRWESDDRLAARLSALESVIEPTLAAAEDRAGLTVLPGRGPVLRLTDDTGTAAVSVRLVEGVRRPVVAIPVRDLLNGSFTAADHLAPLLVEAALLGAAGERSAPAWLRASVPTAIAGTFRRRLYERVLGGDGIVLDEAQLFPETPSGADPLWATTRLLALKRIGRGERTLARFVSLRLDGTPEEAALRAVGIDGIEFLDAAADTERARAIEDARAGGPLPLLGIARTALRDEEPSAAAAAPTLKTELDSGTLSPYVAAEVRMVLAEVALQAGNAVAAREMLAGVEADPGHVLRPAHAQLLAARTAVAAGDRATAATLYRRHAADHPDSPAADEALSAVGLSPEIARRIPGVAEDLVSSDPSRRGRAATRLGETGDAGVAPVLRVLARDEVADVRRLSLAALALAVGEEARADLDRGTRDPDEEVRAAALRLLALAATDGGLPRAREMERDPSALVREAATAVLAPSRAAAKPTAPTKPAARTPDTPTPRPARTKTTAAPGITPAPAGEPRPKPVDVKPPKPVPRPVPKPGPAPAPTPSAGAGVVMPPPVPSRPQRVTPPAPKPTPATTRTQVPPRPQPKPPRPPAHRTDDARRKPPPPRPRPQPAPTPKPEPKPQPVPKTDGRSGT